MSIESFDLYNPPSDFINNVYKYYNLLREKSPIHKNSDGSYYVLEHWRHSVTKWNEGDNQGTTVAGGNYGSELNNLQYPYAMHVDDNDNIVKTELPASIAIFVPKQRTSDSETDLLSSLSK